MRDLLWLYQKLQIHFTVYAPLTELKRQFGFDAYIDQVSILKTIFMVSLSKKLDSFTLENHFSNSNMRSS